MVVADCKSTTEKQLVTKQFFLIFTEHYNGLSREGGIMAAIYVYDFLMFLRGGRHKEEKQKTGTQSKTIKQNTSPIVLVS